MSAVVFTLLTLVKSRLKISFRQFLFAVIMQHMHKASIFTVKQACSVALTQQVCSEPTVWVQSLIKGDVICRTWIIVLRIETGWNYRVGRAVEKYLAVWLSGAVWIPVQNQGSRFEVSDAFLTCNSESGCNNSYSYSGWKAARGYLGTMGNRELTVFSTQLVLGDRIILTIERELSRMQCAAIHFYGVDLQSVQL